MPSVMSRRMWPALLLLAGLTGGCAGDGSLGAATDAPRGAALYGTLRQASVKVLVGGHMAGSGCFVDADGHVLTAAHVVKGAGDGGGDGGGQGGKKSIEVLSSAVGRRRASRVAVDLGHDVALLRVSDGGGPYPFLEIAREMPAPTAEVLLFSSPLWRHDLMLEGSVAKPTPSYCWQPALRCYVRCFYVAGASPVGSSGGCWTDTAGRVVGVQQGYLNNKDGSPVGIAYASPPDAIRELVASKRSREAATLGGALDEVWTQPKGFIARLPKGTEGIVTPVPHKGGPIARAGFTKETVIKAADGEPVAYLDDLLAIVRSKKPGDEITLTVIEPIGTPAREVTLRLGKVGE